jgi:FdhE protein
MEPDINKIEDSLNSLRGKEYISESTIDFFRDITRAQYKIKSQLHENDTTFSLTEDEVKEKLQNGKTLVSWDDIPVKKTLLKDLFQEMCEIMKSHENTEKKAVQKIINAESGGDLKLDILIEKLFLHDSVYFLSLSRDLDIGEDVLVFIALSMAKPFVETVAEKVRHKVLDDKWLRNYCPVCGGCAQISKLDKEDGKRKLYCLLCGSEWRYMRLKCSFCGDEQASGLKFLAEEGSPYRIDLCEKCRRYIKTFNEKSAGSTREIIPAVEDLATMYLDILAEKEGYERSWFFPPSAGELKAGGESKALH